MITYKDYIQDVDQISSIDLPWESFDGANIFVTGATGLIGSCLVDVLCFRRKHAGSTYKVYAMSRSEKKLKLRFPDFFEEDWFIPVIQDIKDALPMDIGMDYIINCASNAHPRAYAEDPVGTITTNVLGLNNLMEHATKYGTKKVLEMSSVEVYGSTTSPEDDFDEKYCGYIDCNTLRAGYPESKRVCEALCQAYLEKYQVPIVIARPCRIYGPTMEMSDSKATAQFFKNVLAGEDIILKSKGDQVFSYAYMADVVSASLYILFNGKNGEAYNISDPNSVVSLAELAKLIAHSNGRSVKFDLPDETEKKGFSGAQRGVLLSKKLEDLGWCPKTNIEHGIKKTISILKKIN